VLIAANKYLNCLVLNVDDNLLIFVDIQYRWVDCYFPFTHPSWELEIFHDGSWLEVLGSGLLEQKILQNGEYSMCDRVLQ